MAPYYTVRNKIGVISLDVISKTKGVHITQAGSHVVHSLRQQLMDCFVRASQDNGISGVVLVGSQNSFLVGSDPMELLRKKTHAPPSLHSLIATMEKFKVPVICGIHGQALGVGMELSLGAHWRVAHRTAKLGFTDIQLGLMTSGGGAQHLTRLVGPHQATQLLTRGHIISAEEAHSIGLVDHVFGDTSCQPEQFAVSLEETIEAAIAFAHSNPTKRLNRVHQQWSVSAADSNNNIIRSKTTFIAPIYLQKAVDIAFKYLQSASVSESSEIEKGTQMEINLSEELSKNPQTKALHYLHISESKLAKQAMSGNVSITGSSTHPNLVLTDDMDKNGDALGQHLWASIAPYMQCDDRPNALVPTNCIIDAFIREALVLVSEGVKPERVDGLLEEKIGFAMGPLKMGAKLGIDFLETNSNLAAVDDVTDNEIIERCTLRTVNECFKVMELAKGVITPDVLDVLFVRFWGFPRHLGGIIWWAEQDLKLQNVALALAKYVDRLPQFTIAPLLKDVVESSSSVKEEIFFRKAQQQLGKS